MSTISIRRPHNLTPKQAVKVADRVAEDLAAEYGIETEWDGNSVNVSGKGVRGTLHLAPKQFELDLELGFLVSMFAEKIRTGIEAEFDRLLAATPVKTKKK